MKRTLLFAWMTVLLMSCYRMPTDKDFCVIPTTNNPNITREKQGPPLPSLQY